MPTAAQKQSSATEPTTPHSYRAADRALLKAVKQKVAWLSAWTIHNANHERPSRDGLKVGGHQASSASLLEVMTALYLTVLKPQDRVAVKPHASPVFHALMYLLGLEDKRQLEAFRALGGAQSYPSRTKDKVPVDFSTGSVGLGVAITAFASLVQDMVRDQGALTDADMGRMIAIMGDAELDEGNIYEAMIEGAKHDLRNCWWIIDYNRQSLDATTAERMVDRFEQMFEATDWQVVTLKYGRALEAAFAKPGGQALQAWIDTCPNDLYSALTFKGGAAWRAKLLEDIGGKRGVKKLLESYDDEALGALMTNLAGHDIDLLVDTFQNNTDPRPQVFVIYTIKGVGLPFAGHKDNHAGLMNPTQMAAFKSAMKIADGEEWGKWSGLDMDTAALDDFMARTPFLSDAPRDKQADTLPVPARASFPMPTGDKQATQVAFGRILNDLAKSDTPLADRIVTTSPDVTVSTNLGGWVNQRGRYARADKGDVFKAEKVMSPQAWGAQPAGQHLELGIAEHNLFLALAALGLSDRLFGHRLLPIGTLYDPFINRGLDALNYACYMDARFMLVATPAGITLGPEGGAHQSIHTPLVGMAQPKLTTFEPAYADELSAIMRWGFDHMQRSEANGGGSIYLRLSTRVIDQPERDITAIEADLLKGAYWQQAPGADCDLILAYAGAIAPEVLEAASLMADDIPGLGILAMPGYDRAHKDWRRMGDDSHIAGLIAGLRPDARIVTIIDGAPSALSWLGSIKGHRVQALGIEDFGQSGDLVDLYREYGLDAEAIIDAAAKVLSR